MKNLIVSLNSNVAPKGEAERIRDLILRRACELNYQELPEEHARINQVYKHAQQLIFSHELGSELFLDTIPGSTGFWLYWKSDIVSHVLLEITETK